MVQHHVDDNAVRRQIGQARVAGIAVNKLNIVQAFLAGALAGFVEHDLRVVEGDNLPEARAELTEKCTIAGPHFQRQPVPGQGCCREGLCHGGRVLLIAGDQVLLRPELVGVLVEEFAGGLFATRCATP